MQRRVGILFATTVLISIVLGACRTRTALEEDEKKAAINVVLAYEKAVQNYDFDGLDSLNTPDARSIDESYPQPLEPGERRAFQSYKDADMRIDYHPQDAVAKVRNNFAWVTVTLHSVWKADTPTARAMLGGSEYHGTYVESFILMKTAAGWKITFHHTSTLPADFGVEPDYRQEGVPILLSLLNLLEGDQAVQEYHGQRDEQREPEPGLEEPKPNNQQQAAEINRITNVAVGTIRNQQLRRMVTPSATFDWRIRPGPCPKSHAHPRHERREAEYLPIQWYPVRAIQMGQRRNDVHAIDVVESVGGEVNESEEQKAVAIFEPGCHAERCIHVFLAPLLERQSSDDANARSVGKQ